MANVSPKLCTILSSGEPPETSSNEDFMLTVDLFYGMINVVPFGGQ